MQTRLSSKKNGVIISDNGPTVLIGERINPTGRQKISTALKMGDMTLIQKEALAQVQAGADIIDVNAGIVGIDESVLLPQAVQAIMDTVDVPLCLDSSNPKALEAALEVYQGKPLINSVTDEEHSLKKVLPLVKEYSAAVIGLVLDDEGISNDPDRRVSVAYKIVERAESLGIPREDIIIDCLVQPVGADSKATLVTIDTIRKIKTELQVNLAVGASNSSFGLPDRDLINCAFIAIAIAAGVTCAIANVARVRSTVLATDLLMGCDNYAMRYITAYRQHYKI